MSVERLPDVVKTIVVVDDDAQTLEVVTRSLAASGHRVVACANYDEGKRALERCIPDIVIADIRLGARNGLQLIWHATQRHPHVRAIAITGFDDLDLRREAGKMGAMFVTKPFTPSALQAVVEQSINMNDEPRQGEGDAAVV
jgi:DNA-binding NtrC family response regulator